MQTPPGADDPARSADLDVALKLDGLVKAFNGKLAVDHVDLSIPAGSMYGLVGPNGAGKTTSLLTLPHG